MIESEIYSRQICLPEIGMKGQAALRAARILVIGAGGLGSTALALLAAAGVGTIRIAENDRLEASNLHRQILYRAEDIGKEKAMLAAARLRDMNPFVTIETHVTRVTASNVENLIQNYDIILDCTDNFATKYLVNDAAFLKNKILIQANLYRYEGQILTYIPHGDGGCMRCLWPTPPEAGLIGDCAEVGVIGTLPAIFGAWQAHEAIKYILGLPTLDKALLSFDSLTMTSQTLNRRRKEDCTLCGHAPSILAIEKSADETPVDFDATHATHAELLNHFRWIDVREKEELIADPIPEALHMPLHFFDISTCPYDKQTPLLVICAHGIRSHAAARLLRRHGWTKAVSLSGGIGSLPLQNGTA